MKIRIPCVSAAPAWFSTACRAASGRRQGKGRPGLFRLLLVSIPVLPFATVFAQGTAFSYPGRLNSGANPANGNYDLTFALFNLSNGGSAVAGPATAGAVTVSNGLFTVALDFGPGVFNGTAYWLEIGIRTNGGGGFTTLTPRQPLTPSPYAIFAGGANAAGLSGTIPAANIANGSIGANQPAAGAAAAHGLHTAYGRTAR